MELDARPACAFSFPAQIGNIQSGILFLYMQYKFECTVWTIPQGLRRALADDPTSVGCWTSCELRPKIFEKQTLGQ